MASEFKRPSPKHSAWMAYAVVFPLLAGAFVTTPIWLATYFALKAIERIKQAS
jgi:hypothetical protein